MLNNLKKYRFFYVFLMVAVIAIGALAYFNLFVATAETSDKDHISNKKVTTTDKSITFDTVSEWNNEYQLYVMYPKTENAKINDEMKQELDRLVGEFKKQVANKDVKHDEYELNLAASVNYSDQNAINFKYTGEEDLAGTHITFERNYLFDRKTSDIVTIEDIIKKEGFAKLSKEAIEHTRGVLGDKFNSAAISAALSSGSPNIKYFEIEDEDTIYLVFEPGAIADKSLGVIRVPIELSVINQYLNKDVINRIFTSYAVAAKEHEKLTAADVNDTKVEAMYTNKKVDCKVQKCIALTFDDGPSKYTNTLLDVLKQNDSNGTFFMVGLQVLNHPDTVKRAYLEGNEIGNHTWGHVDVAELTSAEFLEQTSRTSKAIINATGKRPIMFRPPYGQFVNPVQIQTLKNPFILWSVDPKDWSSLNANEVYAQAMALAKPGGIMLSHDIYGSTVDAYKKIIPDLKKQGYKLVTVSQLLGFNPGSVPEQQFTKL